MGTVKTRVIAFMDELEHNSNVKIDDSDFDNIKDGLTRLVLASQGDILKQAISVARDAINVGAVDPVDMLQCILTDIERAMAAEAPN